MDPRIAEGAHKWTCWVYSLGLARSWFLSEQKIGFKYQREAYPYIVPRTPSNVRVRPPPCVFEYHPTWLAGNIRPSFSSLAPKPACGLSIEISVPIGRPTHSSRFPQPSVVYISSNSFPPSHESNNQAQRSKGVGDGRFVSQQLPKGFWKEPLHLTRIQNPKKNPKVFTVPVKGGNLKK